jgi:hypothetical protein
MQERGYNSVERADFWPLATATIVFDPVDYLGAGSPELEFLKSLWGPGTEEE